MNWLQIRFGQKLSFSMNQVIMALLAASLSSLMNSEDSALLSVRKVMIFPKKLAFGYLIKPAIVFSFHQRTVEEWNKLCKDFGANLVNGLTREMFDQILFTIDFNKEIATGLGLRFYNHDKVKFTQKSNRKDSQIF